MQHSVSASYFMMVLPLQVSDSYLEDNTDIIRKSWNCSQKKPPMSIVCKIYHGCSFFLLIQYLMHVNKQ